MPHRTVSYPPRRKFSVPMVARMLGVADAKVHAWIRAGELRAVNLAARTTSDRPRWAIDLDDLAAFEAARQAVQPTATRKLRRRAAGGVKEFF